MNKNTLLLVFIALPAFIYIGVKIEILRQKRKYKEEETDIVEKYQSNIFSLDEIRESKKKDKEDKAA